MRSDSAGIYVHVPFCSAICPYCDFAVTVGKAEARARFVRNLLAEIDTFATAGAAWLDGADTIYFGGGTPSALEPAQIDEILGHIRERLPVADDPWIFLEANPEDTNPDTCAAWRAASVRTLSLGLQSTVDPDLRFLGRRHHRESAIESIEAARHAGFATLSLDLMYALPDQDDARWTRQLDDIVALEPDHVSCYQLTIHDGTHFGKLAEAGRLAEMPDDAQRTLFERTHRRLAEAGIPGYEVSNFARSLEHHSRHNRKYWYHVPYLGLGPSAHSFDGASRWWNRRDTNAWGDAIERGDSPVEERESLTASDLALEAVMLGLRTYDGIDLAHLSSRFGLDLVAPNQELLEALAKEAVANVDGARIRPTIGGLAIADTLARRVTIPSA